MSNTYILSQVMSNGTYLSSTFTYLNLGCHMLFVLKNRLKAQGIPLEKSNPHFIQVLRSSMIWS